MLALDFYISLKKWLKNTCCYGTGSLKKSIIPYRYPFKDTGIFYVIAESGIIKFQEISEPVDIERIHKSLKAAKDDMGISSFWGSVRDIIAATGSLPISCLFCFGLGRLSSPVTRHQTALLLLLKV
jgi:hypothetical protein